MTAATRRQLLLRQVSRSWPTRAAGVNSRSPARRPEEALLYLDQGAPNERSRQFKALECGDARISGALVTISNRPVKLAFASALAVRLIVTIASGSASRCLMARGRTVPDRAQLSCDHLRLPFGVERDAENCFALITYKLHSGNRPLRRFIASPERFDEDVWCSFALRTLANHGRLLFQLLEFAIKRECVRSSAASRL